MFWNVLFFKYMFDGVSESWVQSILNNFYNTHNNRAMIHVANNTKGEVCGMMFTSIQKMEELKKDSFNYRCGCHSYMWLSFICVAVNHLCGHHSPVWLSFIYVAIIHTWVCHSSVWLSFICVAIIHICVHHSSMWPSFIYVVIIHLCGHHSSM